MSCLTLNEIARLDLTWSTGWVILEIYIVHPNWSGFMQHILTGDTQWSVGGYVASHSGAFNPRDAVLEVGLV